jgi:hypothetical protein
MASDVAGMPIAAATEFDLVERIDPEAPKRPAVLCWLA